MQTVKATLLLLICLVLLGACGLKGPLYLPNDNPATKPATEQKSDSGAIEEENKEDTEKKKSVFS